MFYISGNLGNNMLNVTDTKDNVTECISTEQAMGYINNGVQIRGISKSGIVFCKSDDLIKDYIEKVRPTLAKLKMMNSLSYDSAVAELTKLAVNIGLCLDNDDFSINYQSNAIIIRSRMICIVYDNNGNYRLQDLKNGVNIVNSNAVSDVTKIGTDSLEFITITVNGNKYKLSDAVSLILKCLSMGRYSSVGSFDNLLYIGYTPSNYIFKVMINRATYSVEFTDSKLDFNKCISSMLERAEKANKSEYEMIKSYVYRADELSIDGLYIKKCNLKRGLDFEKLHEKYKTLKDIYVR